MTSVNNRKSITIVINSDECLDIDYVFIIKNIDVDKITVDKFGVDCRNEIEGAWDNECSVKSVVIKLTEKISTITLMASAKAIEKAVEHSGQIIKNIIVTRPPKAKKVRLTDIELFNSL